MATITLEICVPLPATLERERLTRIIELIAASNADLGQLEDLLDAAGGDMAEMWNPNLCASCGDDLV